VTAGAFLGGALVAVYFLYRTFKAMKQGTFAFRTLIGGSAFILAVMALLPFLPSRFPNIGIPLAYTLAAKEIENRFPMKKKGIVASDQYQLVSNWRVAMEILLGFVILASLIIAAALVIQVSRGRL
jgi:hypothetical protein